MSGSTIKLFDLWRSQAELSKLLITDTLDAVVTWRLSKLVGTLEELDKSRVLLIEKLGELNGSGILEVKSENIEEFNRQFAELLTEPLDGFQPIEVEKMEGAKLNAMDMARLGWLIAEPRDVS